jgi:transcriptional regulator with XRE-family HTH domain
LIKENKLKYQFGDKIRFIREKKGLTLKEVAEKVQVSESLISQIERNRVSPSIDTLMSIIQILDIDLEYLFKDFRTNKKVSLIRAGERNKLVMHDVTYYQLSVLDEGAAEHAIEAFLLRIEPGKEKGDITYGHKGNELGFILTGTGELLYGTEVYQLEKGDSISFPSDIPHILRNNGREVLEALWVVTPPRRLFQTS